MRLGHRIDHFTLPIAQTNISFLGMKLAWHPMPPTATLDCIYHRPGHLCRFSLLHCADRACLSCNACPLAPYDLDDSVEFST
jgi:hypothetical protein